MTSDHPVGPEAYEEFEGEVGRIMSTSTPAWTRPPTAPDLAPNVLIVLVDDLGFDLDKLRSLIFMVGFACSLALFFV